MAFGVALPWATLAASQTVTVQEFSFTPANVAVNAGESVTWRNAGGDGHTAIANNGAFDTGLLNPGASKTIVVGTAGTFDYHCAIHPSMRGTVTVVGVVATTAPPTPPPTVAPAPPPTAAPSARPTVVPANPPTAAPTSAPTTIAPASSAPAASASQIFGPASPTRTAAPTTVAAASSSASPTATPAPPPTPAGDAGPLPLVVGVVMLAGIAGVARYAMRRR